MLFFALFVIVMNFNTACNAIYYCGSGFYTTYNTINHIDDSTCYGKVAKMILTLSFFTFPALLKLLQKCGFKQKKKVLSTKPKLRKRKKFANYIVYRIMQQQNKVYTMRNNQNHL